MVKRIVVCLEQDEYSALLDLAISDLRNPSDELRHFLRMETLKRLKNSNQQETKEISKPKEMNV
jgi:hypothetical protein